MTKTHNVISDLHLGAIRSGGTTPHSAQTLREWSLKTFEDILARVDDDLIILGDLFDSYQVPMPDLLETYFKLLRWVKEHPSLKLTLIPGNHDLSTDSSKIGGFQVLGKLLEPYGATYLDRSQWISESDGIFAIPHCFNQDLLDHELSKVPKCRYLLLHCNYENFFAKESDHSLNLSQEQAQSIQADTIILAHEHNHRVVGKVFVMGNQFPTSVSDCLSPQDKFMHRLTSQGVERLLTWKRDDEYAEVNWEEPAQTGARFIRFVGTAKPEQAVQVAEVIARYRRGSDAFVVANAVRILSNDGQQALELESLEAIRAFDVLSALQKFLTPEERLIIETLT